MPYQSISELLEANGYREKEGKYIKELGHYNQIWITPDEWMGLSVEDFEKKARAKNWIWNREDTVKKFEDVIWPVVPFGALFGSMFDNLGNLLRAGIQAAEEFERKTFQKRGMEQVKLLNGTGEIISSKYLKP